MDLEAGATSDASFHRLASGYGRRNMEGLSMKRKDKLVIAALVALIANAIIAIGIINNAGVSSDESNCFFTEKGVQICR